MLRPNKGLCFIPLFGRCSAWFFFNGMFWNMLNWNLSLLSLLQECKLLRWCWLIFQSYDVFMLVYQHVGYLYRSVSNLVTLVQFRSPSNSDVEDVVEDRLVSVENMTPCHHVIECHNYSQTRSWFQTFLFVSLTENLGIMSNLDQFGWLKVIQPMFKWFFVRGLVFWE